MAAASEIKQKPSGLLGMISNIQLYPEDVRKIASWGLMGFVSAGLYYVATAVSRRNINPCCALKDPCESLNADPIIRDAFIHLQEYRELDPWLFKTALQNVDQLLFLEQALLSKKIEPVRSDKVQAFSHFRVGVNRLNQFQFLIKDKMNSEHAFAANIFVQKIYQQLQTHFINVLHMCTSANPMNLIARAKTEVERVNKAYREGQPRPDPLKKWDELKELKRSKRSKRKSSRRKDTNHGKETSHSKETSRSNKSRSRVSFKAQLAETETTSPQVEAVA
jgi:hypothetical protein